MQTLLPMHSQSLESISLFGVDFKIASPLSLPNLQRIYVELGAVEGWESLCGSLKSLKSLEFRSAAVSGDPPFVPHPAQLEKLMFEETDPDFDDIFETWLSGTSRPFSSLQQLSVGLVSPETLTGILDNCPTLRKLKCEHLNDEHLQVLLRAKCVSLWSLSFSESDFTPDGLSALIAAFPPSITCLSFSECAGLTLSNFRMLLKLPSLRYADFDAMEVDPDERQELVEMAKSWQSPRLRVTWRK
jgi:hypothetical protein